MNNLIRTPEDSIDYVFWSYFLFAVWSISSLASYLKCMRVTVAVYNPGKAPALKLFVIVFRDLLLINDKIHDKTLQYVCMKHLVVGVKTIKL